MSDETKQSNWVCAACGKELTPKRVNEGSEEFDCGKKCPQCGTPPWPILRSTRDAIKAEGDEDKRIADAWRRSGYDISECAGCHEPVVCLPDGMGGWCEDCEKKRQEANDE